jgi:hypothetical protein
VLKSTVDAMAPLIIRLADLSLRPGVFLSTPSLSRMCNTADEEIWAEQIQPNELLSNNYSYYVIQDTEEADAEPS